MSILKIRKISCLKHILPLIFAVCILSFPAFAAEEISFITTHTIVDGADNHFIARDVQGKYGLLDAEGEASVDFEYNDMVFPEDTKEYHFVKVKQGENWGIVDYEGKELVPARYKKVDVYKKGNKIAAGYDGNKTYLYDLDGKEQKNALSGNYARVLSDDMFVGETDIRNDRDNSLLDLKEEGLIDTDPDTDSDESTKITRVGDNIVAQYYCGSDGELFRKLLTDRYIKIYDNKGDFLENVVPSEEWSKENEDTFEGSLILKKAISDNAFLVSMKMPKGKDSFKLIYSTEKDRYSQKFSSVGAFTDNRAFAVNMDDDLLIIDDQGKQISEDTISKTGYERNADLDGKGYNNTKAAFVCFEKDDKIKLYSLLLDSELEDSYKEVIFKDNGYVLLKNDDDKYGVIDNQCNIVVPFGDYDKESLDAEGRALYSDTCVTLVKETGERYDVRAFSSVAKEKKDFFAEHKMFIIAGIAAAVLILILIIVLIMFRNKKKREEELQKQRELIEAQKRKKAERDRQKRLRDRQFGERMHSVDQSEHKPKPSGYLKGLKGEYADALIRIKPGSIVNIGRSQEGNDIIINNPKVSRKHCQIAYDTYSGKYLVRDFSSNGVYLSQGIRLESNIDVPLDEGTIIYIGNNENVFELGSRRS